MTLILSINSPETIWLLADRRLSYKHGKPKDDACKIMILDTTDGTALLGYAGLGATARGTQPADWMSAVLRGRKLTLEQSLSVLAGALKREFPRHMVSMPDPPVHYVVIPAFLGEELRLYGIDLALTSDRKQHFRTQIIKQLTTCQTQDSASCIGWKRRILSSKKQKMGSRSASHGQS